MANINLQKDIDLHANLWLVLQERLDQKLYNSEREKFFLETELQYRAELMCAIPDTLLLQELGFFPIEKSPPQIPIFYLSNG